MASITDDDDDEYLDDPISLIASDDIKEEICDEDSIIDISSSSDEEEIYTSAYGKKNFVLPVTFFDNTRNIRLLNKCKPISINIVDCKQYPTYYRKNGEKSISKSDESSVEIDNKDRSDSENKPKSADAQNVISTSITVPGADSKQEGEKKRRVGWSHCHSFYEKLKTRKENSKQMALNCKDSSQVDLKRNTGLVGMKITDTVFNQIVNTEKTMITTKKDQAENKSKESSKNGAEKQLITEETDAPTKKFGKTFECVVENALSVIFGIKPKENKKSDTEKKAVVAKSTDYTKDKFQEKSENAVDKSFVENRCKASTEKYGEKTLSSTNITSAKDKTKDSNTYIKIVGATLDDLGTTIIPVTDTHTNNVVSNNVAVTEINEMKKVKTHKNSAAFIDKSGDNHDIAKRCNLKIPSKKIAEKGSKLKKLKSQCKSALDISQNTIVQHSLKETMKKSQQASKLNIKSYKRNKDDSFVISKKDKLQCKGIDKHVAYSRDTKQLEKPMAKYANKKNRPGSNSPVIPCTTITVRPGPPKSSQNIPSTEDTVQSPKQDTSSTAHITPPAKSMKHSLPQVIDKPRSTSNDVQNLSRPPKIAMLTQAGVSSAFKYRDNSKQVPVVIQTSVNASSDTKTTACTQNSTSNNKSLKITEYKAPSCYPVATGQIDIKSSVSAPNLTDQNMSKTKQVNTPIKSASFSGYAVQINNQTTNGLIKNQTYLNPQISPSPNPKFSGHNAIIFRRPPPPPSRDSPNHGPPNQRQHIQAPINYRPPYQPMPNGPTPTRFHLPLPYRPPPSNYPPPPPNYSSPPYNLAQVRPNQIFSSPSRMRGIGMGLHNLRFPEPRPPGCRPPLPTPPIQRQGNLQMNLRPPTPQVNKDSFIGNNANGDPIKKINIPPPPSRQTTDTVNDKQMMLAELNNAMMSPDLTANKPEETRIGDHKRKADPRLIEPVKPKYSKPCPLSKKSNVATDLNTKVPGKLVPNVGYSPPILPIWTYEESFDIFSHIDASIKKGVPNNGTQSHTPSKTKWRANIIKLGSKKRTHTDSEKQDKAKKISFEDYRKRAKDGDRIDVDKIRRHNKSKNVTDDYNQDLGYDSDSTVKL